MSIKVLIYLNSGILYKILKEIETNHKYNQLRKILVVTYQTMINKVITQ